MPRCKVIKAERWSVAPGGVTTVQVTYEDGRKENTVFFSSERAKAFIEGLDYASL